jgi:hypothetical protein
VSSICHHVNYNISFGRLNFANDKKMSKRFFAERDARRDQLEQVIANMVRKNGHHDNELLVITFNIGYGYVFSNWYCSVLANGVDLKKLKKHLLLLTTDDEARDLAASYGFDTFDSKFLWHWTDKRVSSSAAAKFATGPHGLLNLITKFGLVSDLVSMGINATIMDTDMVWTGFPLDAIRSECDAKGCDAIFIDDGRPFGSALDAEIYENHHPNQGRIFRLPGASLPRTGNMRFPYLNTGFFRVTQSARMAKFMFTLMEAAFLQQWKGTDQLIWNTLMYHETFADYKWARLPVRRFVPGGTLHLSHHLKPFPVPPELLAIHPSDAARHQDKILKLIRIHHWYFDPVKCAAPFEKCKTFAKCMPLHFEQELVNATLKAALQRGKLH